MESPPETGPPKFKLLNLLSYTHDIFRVGLYSMKKTYNLTKFRVPKWGALLTWGRQNSNFLITHAGHMKISG